MSISTTPKGGSPHDISKMRWILLSGLSAVSYRAPAYFFFPKNSFNCPVHLVPAISARMRRTHYMRTQLLQRFPLTTDTAIQR